MIGEPLPFRASRISRDFWVPVLAVLAGLGVLSYLLVARRSAPFAPRPSATATAPLPDAGGEAHATPGPPEPPARSDRPAPTAAQATAPEVPRPAPREPRTASPSPLALPAPPGPGFTRAAPPEAPAAVPPEPTPGRELKSDLLGYGFRLPNETAWEMGGAGLSRHAIVRRDGTAQIRVWTQVFPGPQSPQGCLSRHLSALRRRLERSGLKTQASPPTAGTGRAGLSLLRAEVSAAGLGPRREAGRYLLAFAADGLLCHGFEGFLSVPAPSAARREVQAASQTFDVDPAVREKAVSVELRERVARAAAVAQRSSSAGALVDAATALAALWPAEADGWQLLAIGQFLGGSVDEALALVDKALSFAGDGGDEDRMRRLALWTLSAQAHGRRKEWPSARAALEEARKVFPDHPALAYAEGCFQALQGKTEKAIDLLEASLRSWPARAAPPRIPHGLAEQVAFARRDPCLRALREEPRFEVLLRRFEARARKAQ
jgi:tetratricopeptide (TPR) repeat protein